MALLDELFQDPRTTRAVDGGFHRASLLWNLPSTMMVRAIADLVTWQKRLETRDTLAAMDQSRLDDIGMSSAARDREVAKPFWRD